MCRFGCLSEGPSTSMTCKHCKIKYCAACLTGEKGKMKSLVKCAGCGKKPQTVSAQDRDGWKGLGSHDTSVGKSGSSAGGRAGGGGGGGRKPLPKRKKGVALSEDVSEEDITSRLRFVFGYFCAYAPASDQLDNAKWNKIFKELGIHGDGLSRTDTDLIFTKVKAKSERRVGFARFVEGMKQAAAKKYGKNKAVSSPLAALCATDLAHLADVAAGGGGGEDVDLTESKAGGGAAKKKKKGDVLSRLTDTSKYTGAHKARFDEHGKGKGMEGRDPTTKGKGSIGGKRGGTGPIKDLSQITRPNLDK